jgi:hypothetical protein
MLPCACQAPMARRSPGFRQTAHLSDAICVGFHCGPLNCRLGSAIRRAAVVLAGWDAWRRAFNVLDQNVDTNAQGEARVALAWLGLENEGELRWYVEVSSALYSLIGDVSDWPVGCLWTGDDVLACSLSCLWFVKLFVRRPLGFVALGLGGLWA